MGAVGVEARGVELEDLEAALLELQVALLGQGDSQSLRLQSLRSWLGGSQIGHKHLPSNSLILVKGGDGLLMNREAELPAELLGPLPHVEAHLKLERGRAQEPVKLPRRQGLAAGSARSPHQVAAGLYAACFEGFHDTVNRVRAHAEKFGGGPVRHFCPLQLLGLVRPRTKQHAEELAERWLPRRGMADPRRCFHEDGSEKKDYIIITSTVNC